jgi:stage 0 sporulation protein B (sporulation initiation phosphotransferase)
MWEMFPNGVVLLLRWKGIRTTSGFIVSVSLLVLVLLPGLLWIRIGVGLIAAFSMIVLLYAERERREAEHRMKIIHTLNHHRHDWMNEVQVLFGYIRMKKYDKLQPYVDKLMAKVHHTSGMTKLGIPSLVVYLLTFPTRKTALSLEIELDREIRLDRLPIDNERLSQFIRDTIEAFDRYAESAEGDPNTLSVGFDQQENSLLLDFIFTGTYQHDLLRDETIRIQSASSLEIVAAERQFDPEKAIMTVELPFRAE